MKNAVGVREDVSVPFTFTVPTLEYRSLPIPGLQGTKVGDCFVRVMDLPPELDGFMEVNPRVPNRTQKGVLSGPVVKGITKTLLESPEDMALKNQGIYLLVEDATHTKAQGGDGKLSITLTDVDRHGIVNGGHTYAAIRDAIESAEDEEMKHLERAYVRLHILQGVEDSKVAEIAEGLNRSKQVDDSSLADLQNAFEKIKQVMKGKDGENEIAYYQGENKEVDIVSVLQCLEGFNGARFDQKKHPHSLYNKPKSALQFYKNDLKDHPSALNILLPKLPEMLKLSDQIRLATPDAAKRVGFEFGRMKTGRNRAGSGNNKNIRLPFLNETMNHRVPDGWLYPMLVAFRANVEWDMQKDFEWKVPLDKLLPAVIDDLVGVCVTAHRDNLAPDKVGKRESIYVQCYDKVELHLFRARAND